jgi:hypothetical protein
MQRHRPKELPMDATEADLHDAQRRASAIGSALLFGAWPAPALLRLARAASVATHAPGALVVKGGPTSGLVTAVVGGTVLACVTGPEGKRVTFKIASGTSVHGVIPLVDGREMANDVIAVDKVTAIYIPHAALRAELREAPTSASRRSNGRNWPGAARHGAGPCGGCPTHCGHSIPSGRGLRTTRE